MLHRGVVPGKKASPDGGEGIHLDLSMDGAKILENNQLIYNCWYQLYLDNIHHLFIRLHKWEKSG